MHANSSQMPVAADRTLPLFRSVLRDVVCILLAAVFPLTIATASEPGLPFTEDFSDPQLRDDERTNANWSTQEQALILGWRAKRFGAFGPGVSGVDIAADGHWTYSVVLGDVDGDGDLDLVAGNYYSQRNRLYLNNGTADPWNGVSGVDITADGHNTTSFVLGDVDGDGDLDLVAGNYSFPNRLYLNNGTADPWNGVSGVDITADASDTASLVLGDVDGDGDLDLVAGNSNSQNRLYLNNGTADPWNWVSGVDITADVRWTRSVALGDVDGDGDLDLVAGNFNSQRNRLYLNNGTAYPWDGVSGVDITVDTHGTYSVVLGDVDGDGDLDLVAGNSNSQRNRLYLNNGTADPWNGVLGVDITADESSTFSAVLGDVDGDGDLDLLAGNSNSQRNRLYLNNGTADPWNGVSGVDITADANDTASVVLGDVDGDGDLDLVAGNSSGQRNRLYLNNGTADPWNGVSGVDITADASDTASVVLGDVDGDGDLDLVAGNYNFPNRLYLNNGTADPWNGVSGVDITADTSDTASLVLGDVDGDGDLDLVTGNYNFPNRLYLNNGTADPWNGVSGVDITADGHWTYSVVLGDVDGDGDPDLVAGNSNGQRNRLYLNNGTADPWNGVSGVDITVDTHGTYSVVLGDVDDDGDLDLVAGNFNSQRNRLYLNNGTADPWNGVSGVDITADASDTASLVLGDVDGDGDLDLVAGNSNSQNRLYLNNGTADPWNWVSGVDITADVRWTRSVALGDVDGDGDLDLLAGNFNSQRNRLYLNNGTADPWNGVSGVDITVDTHGTYSVVLGDVDGDGDLDLVAGNSNSQRNRLYLNNGTANSWKGVSGVDITADEHSTASVVLGDVDGDGDLDLVAGDSGPNHLYLNNGTADPWSEVSGVDITVDTHGTYSVVLGDVDGDGDLDLVAGNFYQPNRLYLNNGTADPWNGVSGVDITADSDATRSVVLGDVDGDGDLDLVAGNRYPEVRLYLNNGTADPWNGVSSVNITADNYSTYSVVLGDVDGDGDLDLVAGNWDQPNRLYLNNGTADPWNGVSGVDITADDHWTWSVVLGDVDGDGDLDLVAGNDGNLYIPRQNRLYLNNGTADPWNGVSGVDITADASGTASVVLGDVDGDGDLDLVAGSRILVQRNRLYLNNGTADPWNGVSGVDITVDTHGTHSVVLGDVDRDGDLDLVAGNSFSEPNRLYRRILYHTGHGRATSLEVDTETDPIPNATLTATAALPPNTAVDYWLSNDGGQRWFMVRSGERVIFPTNGGDLRWKAELSSLLPARTPRVEEIQIITEIDSDGDGPPDVVDNCPDDPNPDQANGDSDELGDVCDNCPQVWNPDQSDNDMDGWGNVCDNCPEVWSPDQSDNDMDGSGDVCDNCASVVNPGQTDFDADGEGDHCDLDDGMIYILPGQPDRIEWQEEQGYTSWDCYRGDLEVLKQSGVYTQQPGSNPLAQQDCGLTDPWVEDSVIPQSGEVAFCLTTGVSGGIESSLGQDSSGTERVNDNPCP